MLWYCAQGSYYDRKASVSGALLCTFGRIMSSCALRSQVITYGLQATTTAAATTTPESNDLIGSMGENNHAVGAERILVELLEVVCQTTTGNFQI